MSARTETVALLAAHLPADVVVMPYSRQIDPPSKSTVMVRIDEVKPARSAWGFREYTFALVLIAAQTLAGAGDDELDALLEDVLFALEKDDIPNGVTWSQATRATYQETNPAYEVAITVATSKEQ